MSNNYVAIMAGGIGSRFWPASRTALPKQFLDILGTGKTLLQSTFDRFSKICPPENIFILTNKEYADIVKQQLPQLSDNQILGEPQRKNTAPCIAYAAQKIALKDSNANIIVAPSDHIVLNEDEFVRISNVALNFVSVNDALVTLGIVPTRPDTGYGYIQYLEKASEEEIYKVKTFAEKPNLETAKKFIASGDFLWNAGIFIWNVQSILKSLDINLKDIYEAFHEVKNTFYTENEAKGIEKAFSICPSISIDYGIMEKADNVFVIPSSFGWSDLGTWKSLYEEKEKDENQNAITGENIFLFEAENNMIHNAQNKLIVLQGLKNYIVVDTPDALLICNKDEEQRIKDFTNEIKKTKGNDKYL